MLIAFNSAKHFLFLCERGVFPKLLILFKFVWDKYFAVLNVSKNIHILCMFICWLFIYYEYLSPHRIMILLKGHHPKSYIFRKSLLIWLCYRGLMKTVCACTPACFILFPSLIFAFPKITHHSIDPVHTSISKLGWFSFEFVELTDMVCKVRVDCLLWSAAHMYVFSLLTFIS